MIRVIVFMGALLGTACALAAQRRYQPVSQDEKKEIPKITFKSLF